MRKRKEEIEGPWVWIKARVRTDIDNYFIFVGIFLIIIFFMLSSTIGGPYIGTYVRFVEDNETYIEMPIWIVFMFMGSLSLFMGFLLKIPRLIRGMDPRLRIFSLAGLVLTGANMVGVTVLFLFWFGGLINRDIYYLGPILLLVTICVSTIYLIYYWIVIKRGYRKHLPL